MNKIISPERILYKIENGVEVPDGTMVFPIIGPRQRYLAGLPVNDDMSVAYGELEREEESSVHIHPEITHLTYVLSGKLQVRMKGKTDKESYTLDLNEGESAYTLPRTFFQLINRGETVCRVLYTCTPGFVFELDESGNVKYNDAIVLPYNWEELKKKAWFVPEIANMDRAKQLRDESLTRMKNG